MEQKNLRKELEARIIEKALKDEAFRKELLSDPHASIGKELGISIPESIKIKVFEEKENDVILCLPHTEGMTVEISDIELEGVAGGLGDASAQWGTCGPGTQCEIC